MTRQKLYELPHRDRKQNNWLGFYCRVLLPLCILSSLIINFVFIAASEGDSLGTSLLFYWIPSRFFLAFVMLAALMSLRRFSAFGFHLNRFLLFSQAILFAFPMVATVDGWIVYPILSLVFLCVFVLPNLLYFEKRRALFTSGANDDNEMDSFYYEAIADPESGNIHPHRRKCFLFFLFSLLIIFVIGAWLQSEWNYQEDPLFLPSFTPELTESDSEEDIKIQAEEFAAMMGYEDFDSLLLADDTVADKSIVSLPYSEKTDRFAAYYGWDSFVDLMENVNGAGGNFQPAYKEDWVFTDEEGLYYHCFDCPVIQALPQEQLYYFESEKDALDSGSMPCPDCFASTK